MDVDEYAPEGAMGSLVADAVSSVRDAVQSQAPKVQQVASSVAQTATRVATQAATQAAKALPVPTEPRQVSWKRIAAGVVIVGGLGYLAWRMGWLSGRKRRKRRRR